MRASFAALVITALLLLAPFGLGLSAAFAQGKPAPPTPKAQPDKPKTPEEELYFVHMTNGIRLFELKDFGPALSEFEAAYKAVPKASPLINAALCYRELKKYPRAVAELELALSRHPETMSAEDKEAAKKAIEEMKGLFAFVTISVKPPNARVSIDGDEILAGARERVPVSPGEHTVLAAADGFVTDSKKFAVVSTDHTTVELDLVAARGSLRVLARKPETMIEIDGQAKSPGSWQGELPAGEHRVRAVGETGEGTIKIVAGGSVVIDLAKGPDQLPPLPVAPPPPKKPKVGFYGHLNGAVLVPFRHPTVFSDKAISSGGYVGLRGGYRVHEYAAFEGLAEYGNVEGPANGAGPKTYSLSSLRFGPSLRLMSPGDLIRFVGTLGGGVAIHLMHYEDLVPDTTPLCVGGNRECDSNGVDVYFMTEVGGEIDFDHVLIGLSLALYVSGTKGIEDNPTDPDNVQTTEVGKPYENMNLPMIGPRLYIGYAFW